MRIELKPLEDQVLVVTGAASGIGLAITEQAVRRGAAAVVAVAVARNAEALGELRARLTADGARIETRVADVTDTAAVERVADHTL